MEKFYPNSLKIEEIEGLDDWKLLVSCIHFGPTRRDCIKLNYGYRWDRDYYKNKWQEGIWLDDICLNDDLLLSNAHTCLYEEFKRKANIENQEYICYPLFTNWKVFAKNKLKELLLNYHKEQI